MNNRKEQVSVKDLTNLLTEIIYEFDTALPAVSSDIEAINFYLGPEADDPEYQRVPILRRYGNC